MKQQCALFSESRRRAQLRIRKERQQKLKARLRNRERKKKQKTKKLHDQAEAETKREEQDYEQLQQSAYEVFVHAAKEGAGESHGDSREDDGLGPWGEGDQGIRFDDDDEETELKSILYPQDGGIYDAEPAVLSTPLVAESARYEHGAEHGGLDYSNVMTPSSPPHFNAASTRGPGPALTDLSDDTEQAVSQMASMGEFEADLQRLADLEHLASVHDVEQEPASLEEEHDVRVHEL